MKEACYTRRVMTTVILAQVVRVIDASTLRGEVLAYLESEGWTKRRGRNGRKHAFRSFSTFLRNQIERQHGPRAPFSQQAIWNFLAGRSKTIRYDNAGLVADAIHRPLALIGYSDQARGESGKQRHAEQTEANRG